MNDLLQRLRRRKLVQWALAYLAAAWVALQILDLVLDSYHWPDQVIHLAFGVLGVGFVVVLLLAWYHGDRGVQRISGVELLIIALVLAVGGGVLWNFSRAPGTAGAEAKVAAASKAQPPAAAAPAIALRVKPPVDAQPVPAKSIAVLPFENLSADKKNAYFADGMQDLILTKLADIGDLKVISRTSTMKYASHPDDLKTIGRQLGVATILEGTVQKAGNQVLINVQLIDARTDGHIWAQSYQRTLDNIFGVEGEVADKVAKALNAELTSAQSSAVAAVPTHNAKAFDAYLRGEAYIAQVLAGKFRTALPEAVAAYQEAVEHDPNFALAWAKLAFAQGLLSYASVDTSEATRHTALANGRHALALAPNLAEAHFALGYVYRFGYANYDEALAQFKMARAGMPNSAKVEAAIGYIQQMRGDTRAAAAAFHRASARDPRNPNLALSLGKALTELHEYDDARRALQRMLAVAPDDAEAYASLAELQLLAHGDADAALAELARAPVALRSDPTIGVTRVGILLMQRDIAAARQAVAALTPGGRFVTPARIALWHARVSRLSGDATAANTYFAKGLSLAQAAVARGGEAGLDAQSQVALAQAGLGHKHAALHALAQLRAGFAKAGRKGAVLPPSWHARIYVLLNDNDHAIAALEQAATGPVPSAAYVRLALRDPTWDPIRADPRFQALLKRYTTHAAVARSSNPQSR